MKKLHYLIPAILISSSSLQASDGAKYFAKGDKDKDGKVTAEEFATLIPSDPDKAAKRFVRIDRDKDGFASLEEFQIFYDKAVPAPTENAPSAPVPADKAPSAPAPAEKVASAAAPVTSPQASEGAKYFTKGDKNKDGKVTAEEFATLIPSDPDKAAKRFVVIDRDKDGFATIEEFQVFYDKTPK